MVYHWLCRCLSYLRNHRILQPNHKEYYHISTNTSLEIFLPRVAIGKFNHDPNFTPLNEISAFYEYYNSQLKVEKNFKITESTFISKLKIHWSLHIPYAQKIILSSKIEHYPNVINCSSDERSFYINTIYTWRLAEGVSVSPAIDSHFTTISHGWRYFTHALPFDLDYF